MCCVRCDGHIKVCARSCCLHGGHIGRGLPSRNEQPSIIFLYRKASDNPILCACKTHQANVDPYHDH